MTSYLNPLPASMNGTLAKWAYISLSAFATLPGHFNRSIFEAPWATTEVSNHGLAETLAYLNTTDFVAYDPKFFGIIGPDASITHIQELPFQSHEAPCYIKDTNQLFFVEWGPPGGDNGTHSWQYLLDLDTKELNKITTEPPTYNAHGCVYFDHSLYVVTDGYSDEQTGQLVKIDPKTLKQEVILNNYLLQPFAGFNDLDIDRNGNFYLTDSKSGWGRSITTSTPPTLPTVYFYSNSTSHLKPLHTTTGNANGIALSPDGATLYIPDTGVSEFRPSFKNPYGQRELWAFDVSHSGSVLSNKRLLSSPISYFWDGIRVSRHGWIFAGAGDGVDVVDPDTGFTLGSIRVGGGSNGAVSLAFGRNELWIVGRGGVWHVGGVRERLDRGW
ncbi:hypothetical protein BJY04DRAFT_230926 [Aspergillus karnatakaensis]|uniref:SMP-30/gluconolactonase/LRE family protein n=1 Tax=Aspergillus karnatakaensis TaxID=1810916 RepID=UPI003CCDFFEF